MSGNSSVDSNKLVLNGGRLAVAANETVGRLFYAGIQHDAGTYGSTSSGDYSKKSDFPAWPTAAHAV